MRLPTRHHALAPLRSVVVALAVAASPVSASAEAQGSVDDVPPPSETMARLLDLPRDNVRGALEAADRSEADRARDANEGTEAILRAAAVARDTRVADLVAGDGHFAEALSRAVKRFGKTWAGNDPALLEAPVLAAWKARLDSAAMADVSRLDEPLASPLPRWVTGLDAVFLRDAYHLAVARGIDRTAMHAVVVAALAPGGRYVVSGTRAAAGSDAATAAAACRVDEALVRREVEAAGLRLAQAREDLAVPTEDHATNACGAGRPDRFLLVFEKPRG